ncbi:hypothetical protein [Streptomyces sp. SID14515]|uniref:hypothetical protein n=1 Tax=Streptomyces sp. SID14515 TaxID=2706074 RepID=UPI0013CBE7C4|nr:hypothetical protein [Streptomyces sp. SID14515]NEB42576.1 hypothetical protein [Streptomyces sp. SID14515]
MTDILTSRPLGPAASCASASEDELSLDVEEADRAADKAINFKLGTTTLPELVKHTHQLKGQVALFAGVVRSGGSIEARASGLEADQLLAMGPAGGSLPFNSWLYARDLGRLLRRLVTEYRGQLEGGSPALPTRTPRASLNRLTESRQAYLVPSGLGPEHKPMPADSEDGRP